MNKFRQQLILLFALMGLLSAVTVFFVTATSTDASQEAVDNSRNDDNGALQNIEVTESEGNGLIAQSINGLIALNKDFNTGLSVISGDANETEENESLDPDTE